MEIREYLPDIMLTVIMVVSTLVLILRFWQDLIIAIAAALMMLSIGGLFLSLQVKMRRLEQSVVTRERMLRTNLEESRPDGVRNKMMAITHLDELVAEMARRAYNNGQRLPYPGLKPWVLHYGISSLSYKMPVTWEALPGIAAIDANNTLYQFLTIIRQP